MDAAPGCMYAPNKRGGYVRRSQAALPAPGAAVAAYLVCVTAASKGPGVRSLEDLRLLARRSETVGSFPVLRLLPGSIGGSS
jgi:hypothetical protein